MLDQSIIQEESLRESVPRRSVARPLRLENRNPSSFDSWRKQSVQRLTGSNFSYPALRPQSCEPKAKSAQKLSRLFEKQGNLASLNVVSHANLKNLQKNIVKNMSRNRKLFKRVFEQEKLQEENLQAKSEMNTIFNKNIGL